MVTSVEPGLYCPWGGVRIEDLAEVKKGKVRVLGKTNRYLLELEA